MPSKVNRGLIFTGALHPPKTLAAVALLEKSMSIIRVDLAGIMGTHTQLRIQMLGKHSTPPLAKCLSAPALIVKSISGICGDLSRIMGEHAHQKSANASSVPPCPSSQVFERTYALVGGKL